MEEREAIRQAIEADPELAELVETLRTAGASPTWDLPGAVVDNPEEAMTVLCGPATDIDGSLDTQCHGCGATIWLSPSTLKMVAQRTGRVRYGCIRCVTGWAKEEAERHG